MGKKNIYVWQHFFLLLVVYNVNIFFLNETQKIDSEIKMDIDLNNVDDIVNEKCTMMHGSLLHRLEYLKTMDKQWIIQMDDYKEKEIDPSKVIFLYTFFRNLIS